MLCGRQVGRLLSRRDCGPGSGVLLLPLLYQRGLLIANLSMYVGQEKAMEQRRAEYFMLLRRSLYIQKQVKVFDKRDKLAS